MTSPQRSAPYKDTVLDDVLDLLIHEYADEQLLFTLDPPPLLFGLIVPKGGTNWRADPDQSLDLFIKPVWNGDPIDVLDEFAAPAHWQGLGLVAASRAHVADESFEITLGVVVDRHGAASARLLTATNGAQLAAPVATEGRLVDALREALMAQSPPHTCRHPGSRRDR